MNGYTANISGAVQDSNVKDAILAAAGSVAGVRSVNDNLQLIASPITANVDATDGETAAVEEPTEIEADSAPEAEAEPETIPTEPEPEPEPSPTADSESLELTDTDQADIPTDLQETNETETEAEAEAEASNATAEASTPARTETASDNTAELNLAVADRTLTLTGRVQDQRELRPIVEVVMTTFDLNYVSNKTRGDDSIAAMDWMDGLVSSIPALEGIKNPSIDIFNQQITLSGTVETEAEQQSIINSLQTNLPDFSVENSLRIDASASTNAPVETTAEPEKETPSDLSPETETETNQDTEVEATAEDQATSDDDAKRQAEIEEQFRIAARERERAEQARAEAEAEASAQAKQAAEVEAAAEAERAAKEAEEAAAQDEKEAAEIEQTDPVTIASQELSAAFAALPDTRILFRSGSDVFTADTEDNLDVIAELLSEYPIVPVDIKGHTDSQGDESANLALSQLRANAVRDYLVSKGISVFRLSSFGYGESVPIASNDTPDGRAANRRIEFSF